MFDSINPGITVADITVMLDKWMFSRLDDASMVIRDICSDRRNADRKNLWLTPTTG
jgi:hypothetical protein ngonS_09725